MSLVAILGAGPIGAATAHRLAQRGRVAGLRLIDANGAAAAGKVLDIRQSGPIERFDTPLASTDDVLAASSAAVIVIADAIDDGEWSGPRGLELVQRLIRAGSRAALVFAGVRQHALMEACATELGVPLSRMVGTSASAMVGAAQAMTAIELDLSAVDLVVVGRPPAFTIVWSTAVAAGSLVADRLPPHRLLAISQGLPRLWPPGPYAIAAATAPVIEALCVGSRRLHCAVTVVDGTQDLRRAAVLLPLTLGHFRVLGHTIPTLSPQERTGSCLFSTESA